MKYRIFSLVALVVIVSDGLVTAQQASTSSVEIGRGVCGSQYYYYYTVTCPVPNARPGMRLQVSILRQISGHRCVYGQSFGLATDNSYLWASRGCVAEFLVSSLVSATAATTSTTTTTPPTSTTTTTTTTTTTATTTTTPPTSTTTTTTASTTTTTTPTSTTTATQTTSITTATTTTPASNGISATSNSQFCGQVGDSGFRIVGGTEAETCEFPWMVTIYNQLQQTVCGGSILDSTHILTASHCFFFENDSTGVRRKSRANELIVFSGSSTMPYTGENPAGLIRRPVTEIITHENYNDTTYENDIAIVKLRSPIIFDGCHRPVCLVDGSKTPQQATNCRTMGWGRTSNAPGATAVAQLQYVDLTASSDSDCRRIYEALSSEKTFCAGGNGKDSCQGDSGGPFSCKEADGKYYVYGVVSAGLAGDCGNILGIYTRVSAFLPWITSKLG